MAEKKSSTGTTNGSAKGLSGLSRENGGTANGVNIRRATKDDLSAINEIYNYYVGNSTATFAEEPESEADRLAWFKKHEKSKHAILVLEEKGAVVGWASLSPYHTRSAYSKSVELSIYLDHRKLGLGLGDLLFQEIVKVAQESGYHALLGLVCSENIGSLELMKKHGFEQVGRLKEVGQKFERWLDVTLVEKII